MEISELTLKIIILLIPGGIATIIYGQLILHKAWTPFRFIINSILFGGLSYLSVQVLFSVCNIACSQLNLTMTIWKNLSLKEIPFKEVLYAVFASIIIPFIGAAIYNNKIVHWISRKLKISYKYGEENLFYFYLGTAGEVYLRDMKNNLSYHGHIGMLCETEEIKEVVLLNVSVYNYETSEFLYALESIYISKASNDLVIEKPIIK